MRWMILIACCLGSGSSSVAETLTVLPAKVTLSGTKDRQHLLLQWFQDGVSVGPVLKEAEWKSSDESVVRIENGTALPVGNGKATLTVTLDQQTATVPVAVTGTERKHIWNFRNQVQSVMSKAGCNSGACHGAAAGKSGFKLSLRGYAPEMDFYSITRDARGRRIVPRDPGRSLLLTKPTGAIPHKGGIRFKTDSREYKVIAEWIAQGHQGPAESDPRLTKLEMLPGSSVLKPGTKQQLIVRATFSDGHTEDVTRWAKYTSSNLSVVKVDKHGMAEVTGHGEGAIVAWYLSNNVVSTITVPYPDSVKPEVFETAAKTNFIDELGLKKLQQLNLPPSPQCNDGEFLRRAFLDTIGVLPTLEETNKFLADTDPEKRNKLIDQLLQRPEFVDYWAHKWADLLLVTGDRLRPKAVETYYGWIREQVEKNAPWDEFARQIVTAKGSTFENGAANFFSLHQDPLDMAETTSMAFLGMSIQCARCHDHPLEKWTNDDYYGMANLFARVRGKGWGGDFRNGDGNRTVFTVPDGELIQPRTGKPQLPRPLEGESISFDDTSDRRIHLAKWLTAPENPYFSKAIVNRVWANFFAAGIVEKVDDIRLTNPPSNPELLEALSDYLVENKYDLKKLMRLILQSNTYQRSGQPLPGNKADTRFYSHYYPPPTESGSPVGCDVTGHRRPNQVQGQRRRHTGHAARGYHAGFVFPGNLWASGSTDYLRMRTLR